MQPGIDSLMLEFLRMRDLRRERILSLFQRFPGKTVVVLTLNLPGTEKAKGKNILQAGMMAFPFASLAEDLSSYDALWVVEREAEATKRALVSLEETHPLGRLWDWDVYPGANAPLSRGRIGLPPRRCFLCERPAKECSRGRTHPDEAIVDFIRQTVQRWENEENGEETLGSIG